MRYEEAIKLRNGLQKDFDKNEPNLIAFLSKSNNNCDNEPDWMVVVFDKDARIEVPNKVNRLEIRGKVQSVARKFYESIRCPALKHIAGELISANEDYVIEHSGDDETIGTLERLKTGFSVNQKTWLTELKAFTDEYYLKKKNK